MFSLQAFRLLVLAGLLFPLSFTSATELGNDDDIAEPMVDVTPAEAPSPPALRPMALLGSEVLPGEFRTLSWSPGQSFPSIDTPVPVLVARGTKPGPVVCLTAAIHGDELNGIEMVRRLMFQLDASRMSGSVIGIPIVNLDGFRRGSRYLADRRDLNRHFPGSPDGSAAGRIAFSLFNEVIRDRCEYLVDLHTGSLKRTNLPQIRGDLRNEAVFAFSRHFGGITVLHGSGTRGTLRRAAVDAGIPAMTLEAGGPNALEESAVDGGVKALETLLQNLGIQPTLRFWGSPQPVFYHSEWVRSDQGGILMSEIELGDSVKKGAVLGRVVDPVSNTGSNIVAPFTGRVIGMAVNQVVQTGFAAYHLGVVKEAEEVQEEAKVQPELTEASPVNTPVTNSAESVATQADTSECSANC
jgi:predicted deacylase